MRMLIQVRHETLTQVLKGPVIVAIMRDRGMEENDHILRLIERQVRSTFNDRDAMAAVFPLSPRSGLTVARTAPNFGLLETVKYTVIEHNCRDVGLAFVEATRNMVKVAVFKYDDGVLITKWADDRAIVANQ